MINRFLDDVPEDKVFWLSNGQKLRNLKELRNALTSMPDDVFNHHVDSGHNDFANWIREVIEDKALANAVQKSRSIHDHILKINLRVMDLEREQVKAKPAAKKPAKKAVSKKKTKKKKR